MRNWKVRPSRPDSHERVSGKTGPVQALFSRYQKWCEQNGERSESNKWLWNRLAERGVSKQKRNSGMLYEGIALIHKEDARYGG